MSYLIKALLTFFWVACVAYLPVSAASEKPPPLLELPINIINNRTVVEAAIAGYSIALILDTGASTTSLFQSKAQDFSTLQTNGQAHVLFPALNISLTGQKLVRQTVTIGTLEFEAENILLIHNKHSISDRLDIQFDGVLGQDFFNSYVVEVDPHKNLLRLYSPGTDLRRFYRTKLRLHMKEMAPHIKLTSKMPWESISATKELMLDTGYPGFMVFWSEKHFKGAARGENRSRLIAENTGIFTRSSFRVGTLRFVRAPVFVTPNEPKQLHERDGLIGSNVLAQFAHVIDFPSEHVLLTASVINFNRIDGDHYVLNQESFIVKNFERPIIGTVFLGDAH